MIYINKKTASRFLAFIRPYWFLQSVAFILAILSTASLLVSPYITKIIIDEVLPNRDLFFLNIMLVILVGSILFQLVISFFGEYIYAWISNNITLDMQQTLFRHMLNFSLTFYNQNKKGDIIYRIEEDIENIQDFLITGIVRFIHDVLKITFIIIMLCWLSFEFFLCSISIIPLYIISLIYFRPKIKNITERVREKQSDIFSFLVERFHNIQLIQTYNTYTYESKKLRKNQTELVNLSMKSTVYSAAASTVVNSIVGLTPVFFLGWGGYQIIEGNLTLGTLIAFMQYLSFLFSPINDLNSLYFQAVRASVSMNHLMEFLELPTQLNLNGIGAGSASFSFERKIVFNGIHFSYDGESVLQDLNMELIKGKKYAIVGASGCGKTTLVYLLCRFYQPSRGAIFIDDTNLENINLFDMRKHVGLVTQNNQVFNDTVWDNIQYGNIESTLSEVEIAAKTLDLDNYTDRDNPVFTRYIGEQGAQLSGGQRQRVAIARAVLKDIEIMILDEATSALDSKGEQIIFAKLKKLYKDKTIILISHRLATVQNADEIICLEKGRIVEQGNHGDLLRKKRYYWQLFKDQLEER